jgi:3-oxoacyl-(acyl-carrier-protein) synthase
VEDPAIELDVVHGEPREAYLEHVLSTSLGFWGNQASLLFSNI